MNAKMNANTLRMAKDYPSFPEFRANGIDLSLTHADTLRVLQRMRSLLGHPIYPGPAQANWGRLRGNPTSRHYANPNHPTQPVLSDAGDIFPARGQALALYLIATALCNPTWIGGLGLYLDTRGPDGNPWIMLHYDLRPPQPHRVLWIREAGKYVYAHRDSSGFCAAFARVMQTDMAARQNK